MMVAIDNPTVEIPSGVAPRSAKAGRAIQRMLGGLEEQKQRLTEEEE